jgi:hypothetical protein
LYCISLIRSVHSDRHRHHTAVSCLFFLGWRNVLSLFRVIIITSFR